MAERRTLRRTFMKHVAAGAAAAAAAASGAEPAFRLKPILASSLYGRLDLAAIVPEVRKAGAEHIDIWPEPHANQREQVEAMGHDAFKAMLQAHGVGLGILTHYDLGPLRLQAEMAVARRLGATMIITGGMPREKPAAQALVEKMKPHLAAAQEAGVVIGIENHGEPPDAIRHLADVAPGGHLGIALAPYHLPQDPALVAGLIEDLGDRLVHVYAWQHGRGCHTAMPKEEELLQMPGRGPLDFGPIVAALRKIRYRGWTEIFMHPVPRGVPILPTAAEVTSEVNRARRYLDALAAGKPGEATDG